MKQRTLNWLCAAIVICSTPMMALARRMEEEREIVDARLENYGKQNISLASSSTALLWILLLFLAAVCITVMFKDAKRSHLD